MKKVFSISATTALVIGCAGAAAAELPTFEKFGFPITQVQVSVLGATDVRERSPTPTLRLQDMPASPHQVAVLTPRAKLVKQENEPRLLKAKSYGGSATVHQ